MLGFGLTAPAHAHVFAAPELAVEPVLPDPIGHLAVVDPDLSRPKLPWPAPGTLPDPDAVVDDPGSDPTSDPQEGSDLTLDAADEPISQVEEQTTSDERIPPNVTGMTTEEGTGDSGGTPVRAKPYPTSGGRNNPVYFVHGWQHDASADCDQWNDMKAAFRDWSRQGSFDTVAYYGLDEDCSANIDGAGSHGEYYAGDDNDHGAGPCTDPPCTNGHTNDTDIRHLAYHFAWNVYNRYSKDGKSVDIVAHSMGGLIVRYALMKVEMADSAPFPPYLYVEDVVTLGTPHKGSGAASGCSWTSDQCGQMRNDADFIRYIGEHGQYPQPSGLLTTDWTVIGSYADGLVAELSATGMGCACSRAPTHKLQYMRSADIGHSDYIYARSNRRTADLYYRDYDYTDYRSDGYKWYRAPWPVRWTEYALYAREW